MVLRSFVLRTGRDMQSFRTEEAKDWLAEQGGTDAFVHGSGTDE